MLSVLQTKRRYSLIILAVSIALSHFTAFAEDDLSEREWSPGSLNHKHAQMCLRNQGFNELGVNLSLSTTPMEGLLTIEVMNKWTEKSRVKYEVVTTIIQYPLKYDYMTKDRHTLLRKAGVTVYRASVERPVAFVVLRRSDLLASPARTENTKVVIAEFRSQVDKNADGIGDLSSCWVELPEVSKK